jgi:hypothetical protein
MTTELLFDFEVCDCRSCQHDGRWVPRWECGCDEDICPECGFCSSCCDGHNDDDDPGGYDYDDGDEG